MGWFDLVVGEAPCTRGFLLLGGERGARLVSSGSRREVSIHTASRPAELRQQNQQSVSRGQLQEAHDKNQGSSESQRESVRLLQEDTLCRFLKQPSYCRCSEEKHR